jgi:hypothetical protein
MLKAESVCGLERRVNPFQPETPNSEAEFQLEKSRCCCKQEGCGKYRARVHFSVVSKLPSGGQMRAPEIPIFDAMRPHSPHSFSAVVSAQNIAQNYVHTMFARIPTSDSSAKRN